MKRAAKNGEKGEKLALDYLQNNAFQILYTNWRNKHAEIDIIAQKNNSIIFVEVKFRSATIYGNHESFVSRHKIKKMKEAATAYIELYDWKGELRFDIIAIENENKIMHFEDAFY